LKERKNRPCLRKEENQNKIHQKKKKTKPEQNPPIIDHLWVTLLGHFSTKPILKKFISNASKLVFEFKTKT
jgi:hypothetical protein